MRRMFLLIVLIVMCVPAEAEMRFWISFDNGWGIEGGVSANAFDGRDVYDRDLIFIEGGEHIYFVKKPIEDGWDDESCLLDRDIRDIASVKVWQGNIEGGYDSEFPYYHLQLSYLSDLPYEVWGEAHGISNAFYLPFPMSGRIVDLIVSQDEYAFTIYAKPVPEPASCLSLLIGLPIFFIRYRQ